VDEINEDLVLIRGALMQIDAKLDQVIELLEDDGEEETEEWSDA
jgi:hypothetical protein